MFKLGTKVTDRMTGVTGSLMHFEVNGSGQYYNFQPAGLNEEGNPADRTWIASDRIVDGEAVPPPLELNGAIIGTDAEDTITGFKGKIVSLVVHINGCVHCGVQPAGVNKKTGKLNTAYDFDIRTLKGPALHSLTEREREASQKKRPSPAPYERFSPTPR